MEIETSIRTKKTATRTQNARKPRARSHGTQQRVQHKQQRAQHRPHARSSHSRPNDLDGDSWRAFLRSYLVEGSVTGSASRQVNGRPVRTDADVRSLHRWLIEARCPTIFGADRFLIAFGLHLDVYFLWCELNERPAWRSGRAPAWHQDEVDAEGIVEWRDEVEAQRC
jgi:hypothetical protein